MNDKQNSLRSLFNEAVEITDAAERDAYLQRACGDNANLRQRLDALLKAHADAGEFASQEGGTNAIVPITEKPGDRIGRYKLLQQIGEGGCGVVYMAEQEEPVRRRVALKVIKLGMDTKSVIARFEAERQALALMDHPNIAKVLDAGATDAGRPYFVMELVKGVRITDYCDQNNLPTTARLDLFTQVCHAIQHAHQKGIIHRDIKPSNILVTLHDGVPVPKVIDFGIAKATDQRLTDKTLFTAFEQFMGTPAYMSPEQAEMSGLDIDTRSDIYALGVLLYELLTGKPPFDGKELLASGLDAMRRTIREQEPARPSTRLTMELVAADVRRLHSKSEIRDPKSEDEVRASSRRLLQVRELIPLLRGDLDWIVMKALEKDRTRRYDTANGLAMDIARHLSNEPVVARPPSNLYRFQKLVRRNKLAFAAASAVLAALILGLGVSTWMFFKEKEARQRAVVAEQKAKTEAKKSEQVAEFLKDMLKGVGPSVALGRDTKMLQEILDKTAEQVGKNLKEQPDVEAELRTTIAYTYYELGNLPAAETMCRETLRLRKALLGETNELVAASLSDLAGVLGERGQLAEAENRQRESLAIRRRLFGNEHAEVAISLFRLGGVALDRKNPAAAEALYREALAIQRKVFHDEHRDVVDSLIHLARALKAQGKLAEAEPLEREGLGIARKLFSKGHPALADSLVSLADTLRMKGNLAEAEPLLRDGLAMRRKLLGDEHPDVNRALSSLERLLCLQGKWAEAEAMERERLARRRKLLGNDHPVVAGTLNNLANMLRDQGKFAEAETMYQEELAMRRKGSGNENREVVQLLYVMADVLRQEGKEDEAETMQLEALAMQRKLLGDEHPEVAVSLFRLATVRQGQGKLAEAEGLLREALTQVRKLSAKDPSQGISQLGLILHHLADVLREQNGLAEARSLAEEAVLLYRRHSDWPASEGHHAVKVLEAVLKDLGDLGGLQALNREQLQNLRARLPTDDPVLAGALATRAATLLDEGKFTEAEPLARECLAIREKKLPNDWLTFNARSMLGGSLLAQKKYAEAEPLLLAGYEGMAQRADKIPAAGKPRLREILQRLVQLYEATGRSDQAAKWRTEGTKWYRKEVEQYHKAANLGGAQALNSLAWLLATCEDSAIRDGSSAVNFAEKAVAATNRKEPMFLDTLAAAYAEVGQFANAVSVQKEAIGLLQNETLKKEFAARLKLYESNSPYRELSAATESPSNQTQVPTKPSK